MLEQPPNLPAPQQVLLQASSASKPCRARRVWVFSLPSTKILPLPMFLSPALDADPAFHVVQTQRFSGCQGLCVTCRLGSVCILDHKGTEKAAQNVYGIFRPRQICSVLRARAEHPGEAASILTAKGHDLPPSGQKGHFGTIFKAPTKLCCGRRVSKPQRRKAGAARCLAQPWGENLKSKSLKKTHFTENKKEKESKIWGVEAGWVFFPSPL